MRTNEDLVQVDSCQIVTVVIEVHVKVVFVHQKRLPLGEAFLILLAKIKQMSINN